MIRRLSLKSLLTLVSAFVGLFLVSNVEAQTFTVSASPQALTVYPGQNQVPVSVSVASSTYSGPVAISLSGLPSGITVSPSPLVLSPGTTGTLLLNVALNSDQEGFQTNGPGVPNTALNTVTVTGAVGAVTATSTLNLTVSLTNAGYIPTPGAINLPIININTNGVPITNGTTNVPGTITITSADGSTSYLPNSSDSDNTGVFHWHGNTTALMPKKAYHVKLNTSLDLLSQMGLSCPYVNKGKEICDKSKSYVLLANYDDKTLLRDWSASALANAIPYGGSYLNETPVPAPNTGVIPTPSGTSTLLPWASHSLFAELFLNGVYEGTYQLIEEVKVDTHRVNITELTETQTSGDVSGGYLLEIDHRDGETVMFNTPQGLPIGIVDPDFSPDPNVPEQTDYITSYVDNAETALFSSNFTDPALGWRAYFDEASAINFYLVNEIMGNVDGGDFYSSDYLYKAVDNPFLYMGPVWDFDISAGNVNYESIVNPTVPWMQVKAIWYEKWFTDPGFKADVTTQFNNLKNNGVFSSWISSITQESGTLQQAAINNFSRWPIIGEQVWPNKVALGSYSSEVGYLTSYLNLRIAYLDSLFNNKAATKTTLLSAGGTVVQGSQQTLSATVTGGNAPTGSISFFANGVNIGAASVGSSGNAQLTTTGLLLGTYPLLAVYTGDAVNGLSSSKTVNITVVSPPGATTTSLATSSTVLTPPTSITLTALVTPNMGTTPPAGTVAFTANGAPLGSAPLSPSGVATLPVSSLPPGANSVVASYGGDSTHQSSTSNAVAISYPSQAQTIKFPAIGTLTFGTNPVALAASATSGLPVTYAVVSGPATVSGNLLTETGAGSVTVQAMQSGSANFTAAPPVSQTFLILEADQSITFPAPASEIVGASETLTATASSGLPVSYATTTPSVCSVTGTTATAIAPGTCSIVASQAGNAGYRAAPSLRLPFNVPLVAQSISFPTIPPQIVGAAVNLVATATSGLPVSFVSRSPSVCSVSGTSAAFVGHGNCTIQAYQAGNSEFQTAANVTQTILVQQTQTISFPAVPSQIVGGSATLTAKASSGIPVSYSTSTPTICSVSGTKVFANAVGSCSVTASQAGNEEYAAALSVTQTFAVSQTASQTRSVSPFANRKVAASAATPGE